MKTKNEDIDRFLNLISCRLEGLGGKLKMINAKHICKDIAAIGEFDIFDGVPIIKIATKHPLETWVGTLMHECGHLDQWESNGASWRSFDKIKNDVSELFTKELNRQARKNFCSRIIRIELDADKRAVELIKYHNIPISTERYIRHANLILFKWSYLMAQGKWPMVSSIDTETFLSESPIEFHRSYGVIPSTVGSIFHRRA